MRTQLNKRKKSKKKSKVKKLQSKSRIKSNKRSKKKSKSRIKSNKRSKKKSKSRIKRNKIPIKPSIKKLQSKKKSRIKKKILQSTKKSRIKKPRKRKRKIYTETHDGETKRVEVYEEMEGDNKIIFSTMGNSIYKDIFNKILTNQEYNRIYVSIGSNITKISSVNGSIIRKDFYQIVPLFEEFSTDIDSTLKNLIITIDKFSKPMKTAEDWNWKQKYKEFIENEEGFQNLDFIFFDSYVTTTNIEYLLNFLNEMNNKGSLCMIANFAVYFAENPNKNEQIMIKEIKLIEDIILTQTEIKYYTVVDHNNMNLLLLTNKRKEKEGTEKDYTELLFSNLIVRQKGLLLDNNLTLQKIDESSLKNERLKSRLINRYRCCIYNITNIYG